MFEVGKTAIAEHQKIVDLLEKSEIDKAYVCGEIFFQTQVERTKRFKDFESLEKEIKTQDFAETAFLIKGSRGMKMERILAVFKEKE